MIVLLFLMWNVMTSCRVNGLDTRLTIVPNPLTLAPDMLDIGGRVTIRCEPPQSSGIKTMLAMTLNKKSTGNPDGTTTGLAVATAGSSNEGKAELKAALQGATVDGSVGNKFIQLSLNQTKCADQAMYNCKMSYFDTQDQVKSAESNKDFFVDVTPGQLSMKAQRLENGATYDSSTKTEWTVNDTLVLTCMGSVGSVRTEDSKTPQLRWMWEYRYSDKNPRDWTLYDGFQTDITSGQQTTRSCYVEQTSILTRQLTVADSGRDYRCVVQRGSIKYDQFAANYYVSTVNETAKDVDKQADSGKLGFAEGFGVGFAVCLVVVGLVVITVICLWRRQQGLHCTERDATSEANPTTPTEGVSNIELSPIGSTRYEAGPYAELKQSDMGQKSVYDVMATGSNNPARYHASRNTDMDGGYEIPLQ